MERDDYILFIDETGTASPNDNWSKQYVLAGCAVLERDRDRIKNWADHIKYKYWNTTDIVFHSREIARNEGDFRILGNNRKFGSFLADMEEFLEKAPIHMFAVVVDKNKAKKESWDEIKIFKETSSEIIKSFLFFLLCQKAKGKIVVESATAHKDFYFHKSLGSFLAAGIPGKGVSHTNVKESLTSISFVTKNNLDTEEQISDLLAYAAKCHYLKQTNQLTRTNRYDDMVIKMFKKKMVSKSKLRSAPKPKYTKHIDSFISLPK